MRTLPFEKRCFIVNLMVEGMSLRSIARISGVSINTVYKLLVDMGTAAAAYLDTHLVNLTCQRIQADELWSFCYCKRNNVPAELRGTLGYGDVWTWLSIDPDTKLIPSWIIGSRDVATAHAFIADLKRRIPGRVQITTDGYKPYKDAVEEAFADDADFAMLVKLFSDPTKNTDVIAIPQGAGAWPVKINGNPDSRHISTTMIERANLTLRMSNRRYARKTNAHSKKLENHGHALAITLLHYNFVRIHSSLRVTPAMAAGVTDGLWGIEDMVRLIDKGTQHE